MSQSLADINTFLFSRGGYKRFYLCPLADRSRYPAPRNCIRYESERGKYTCTYDDSDSRRFRGLVKFISRAISRTFTPCKRTYVNFLITLPIKYAFSARYLVLKRRGDVSCHHALMLIRRRFFFFFFLCINISRSAIINARVYGMIVKHTLCR